jgi:serine/threonine protein kinase
MAALQEGQPAALGTPMSVGMQIAGYRLEELVGRGGMGVVYRAHDLALERSIALKLLSPNLADDPAFRERFLVESRLAASLDHPNVVPIHDAGEADGQLYLAMRYVEGTDLKQLLRDEGPLEPARAIAICSQIADALDTAHMRGLVHRDVKPSNILLDEHDHAYLADFGLTRRLADQAQGFESGLSLGRLPMSRPSRSRAWRWTAGLTSTRSPPCSTNA